ncbi:MAG: Uma2 family endonuclease [Clostridiales bacterium]|nr:Uma2 family endonuclease [Clostridiales bacterium]
MEVLKREYYTYEEWMSLDDSLLSELIDGQIAMMAPPSMRHQKISGALHGMLWAFLRGEPREVFHPPFGIRLAKDEDTVVLPDITVVCALSKLTKEGCTGAPDMVVEVLPPSASRYDKSVKFNKYLQAGVREYWIVDPQDETVVVRILKNGEYMTRIYVKEDTVILTHENIFVGLRPTIAKNLSVFVCVSSQQPARKVHFFSRLSIVYLCWKAVLLT